MRSKYGLKRLQDIALLFQYLYIDAEHRIVFNNGLTDLSLRMDEDYNIFCSNLGFPDIAEICWNDNIHPANCLDIIYRLMEQPAADFPNAYENRWEEIKSITKINLSLNDIGQKKRIIQESGSDTQQN